MDVSCLFVSGKPHAAENPVTFLLNHAGSASDKSHSFKSLQVKANWLYSYIYTIYCWYLQYRTLLNWLHKEQHQSCSSLSALPSFVGLPHEFVPGPKVRLYDSSLLINSTSHCSSRVVLILLGGSVLIKPGRTAYHCHWKTQMDVASFAECPFTFRQHCPSNIPLSVGCLLRLLHLKNLQNQRKDAHMLLLFTVSTSSLTLFQQCISNIPTC